MAFGLVRARNPCGARKARLTEGAHPPPFTTEDDRKILSTCCPPLPILSSCCPVLGARGFIARVWPRRST
jgi:hypothetical protein